MNPEQVSLVQTTFAQVVSIADQAAALFYERLFTLDPAVKPLFTGDMAEQGQKLMSTIGLAVDGLTKPEKIIPVVQALGRKHVGYGVQPEHYDTVATALLWTLEQGLGEGFTTEVKEAWTAAYTLLAGVMQEAAAELV